MSELEFVHALAAAVNSNSRENVSNTPDIILADFMAACLAAFESASNKRENWYGAKLCISGGTMAEVKALRTENERLKQCEAVLGEFLAVFQHPAQLHPSFVGFPGQDIFRHALREAGWLERCCERDTDGDGNCDRHRLLAEPLFKREAATPKPCANPYHQTSGCAGREAECYDVKPTPDATEEKPTTDNEPGVWSTNGRLEAAQRATFLWRAKADTLQAENAELRRRLATAQKECEGNCTSDTHLHSFVDGICQRCGLAPQALRGEP